MILGSLCLLFTPALPTDPPPGTWPDLPSLSFELGSGLAQGEKIVQVATGEFRRPGTADSVWLSDLGNLRWKREEPYGISIELRAGVKAVDVIANEDGSGLDSLVVLDTTGLYLASFASELDLAPTFTLLTSNLANQERMWVVDWPGNGSRILTQEGSGNVKARAWNATTGLSFLAALTESSSVVDARTLAWPGLGRALVLLYGTEIRLYPWGSSTALAIINCAPMKHLARLDDSQGIETIVWLVESGGDTSVQVMSPLGVSSPLLVAENTGIEDLATGDLVFGPLEEGAGVDDLFLLEEGSPSLLVLRMTEGTWGPHPFLDFRRIVYTKTGDEEAPTTDLGELLCAADFDGDGDLDWLLAQESGGLTVESNQRLKEDCYRPFATPWMAQTVLNGPLTGGLIDSFVVDLTFRVPHFHDSTDLAHYRTYVETRPGGLDPSDPLGEFIDWTPVATGVFLPAVGIYQPPSGYPSSGFNVHFSVVGVSLPPKGYRIWTVICMEAADGSRAPWQVVSHSPDAALAAAAELRATPLNLFFPNLGVDLYCDPAGNYPEPGDGLGGNNGGRVGGSNGGGG